MTVRVSKPAFNVRDKLSELDKPVGLKGTELMRSETSQEARDLIGAGRRNKLFNGDMKINQRGSSFTSVGASANTFTLDRWKFYIQNSTARFTVSKDSESPDEFGGSMKIDCTTTDTSLASTDEVYLEQRLEGQDLQDFAKGTSSAKQYTLSFYAKTNKAGTYIVNLLSRDNTTGTVSAAYTVSDTGWNRHTVTFPADPSSSRKDDNDNGEALRVLWWFVAGSAVNSGTLNSDHWSNSSDTGRATGQINFADSTSNIFYLTGCQLEVGEKTTEFEHRSYGEELALCQRYFAVWPPRSGGIPAWPVYTGSNQASAHCWIPYNMRTIPTPTDKGTGTSTTTGYPYNNNGVSVSGRYANGTSPTLTCGGDTSTGSYGINMHFGSYGSGGHEADTASWNGTSPGIFLDSEL
tara:strand:- start:252 stop:1472 length:1221 start_codon:yes stop_codon:yes gene_type:complete